MSAILLPHPPKTILLLVDGDGSGRGVTGIVYYEEEEEEERAE